MSTPGGLNNILLASAAGGAAGYEIERSLRFNSADSAYLDRTPASAGNRKTWTWAGWVKRSALGAFQDIFGAYSSGTDYFVLRFTSSDTLNAFDRPAAGGIGEIATTQVFRDCSAWYHIVYCWDSTNSTQADRRRLYVNGTRITAFSTDQALTQNTDSRVNSTISHRVGNVNANYLSSYLADVHFLDGQTPGTDTDDANGSVTGIPNAEYLTDFGEFDANGIWQPKAYTGTYGTNGFHLDFSDNSTAAALGTDTSGNGNTWTVNNIAPSDGTTYSTDFSPSGGTWYGSNSASDAFNGIEGNYAVSLDTSTLVFAPSTPIPISTSLRLWYPPHGGFESTKTVTIDGVSSVLNPVPNSYYFHDCSALVGKTISTSTPLTITATGSRTQVSVTGIEVDGVILVDGALGDSLVDVPTNGTQTDTGVGGEVRGNYCTLNPLDVKDTSANGSLANGNLQFNSANSAGGYYIAASTFLIDTSTSTGWYWEITATTAGGSNYIAASLLDATFGISQVNNAYVIGHSSGSGSSGISWVNTGTLWNYGASTSPGSFTTGNVLGIAIKNNKIWFSKNNVWLSGNPSTETSPSITLGASKQLKPAACGYAGGQFDFNFGQRPFAYTAPSGFKALCTANLDAPLVTKPSEYMDIALYTGNGTSQTISGLEFSPDLVWIKARSAAYNHDLTDSVRGATKSLYTSLTQGEATDAGALTAFNSDGFSVGSTGTVNGNSVTLAAWTWDAGSSTVSNTDGSITSSVRANPSAGFSVVTYTGNGTNGATIGHGLGVAPAFVIFKRRDTTGDWLTYHTSLGSGNYLFLNSTAASASASNVFAASSTTLTLQNYTNYNANTGTYVAYCFAPVDGYSSFGSYTGNGSADGTFVYTGFRPRFILYKPSNRTATDWVMWDTARNPYNICSNYLLANTSGAEGSVPVIDVLSNGFKLRVTSTGNNGSGDEIVYAAWAESPFQYARAR